MVFKWVFQVNSNLDLFIFAVEEHEFLTWILIFLFIVCKFDMVGIFTFEIIILFV